MMSCSGVSRFGAHSLKCLVPGFLVVSTALLAGCSADVTRFDSASFNLNDPPETASVQTDESRGGYNNALSRSEPRGPYGAGASSVDAGALPPAAGSTYGAPNSATQSYSSPGPGPKSYGAYGGKSYTPGRQPSSLGQQAAYGPPRAVAHRSSPAERGEAVEVRQGDTLYGISRRYHVSVAELMSLNGLSAPSLKLGQKIYLPKGGEVAEAPPVTAPAAPKVFAAQSRASEPAEAPAAPMASVSQDVVARYGGSYTVKQGDSLYSIAKQHHVLFSELQQVNGITDARRVKPGVVLRVPGTGGGAQVSAATPSNDSASAEPERYGRPTTMQPTVINGSKRVASLDRNTANDASPAESSPPNSKFAVAAPSGPPDVPDSVKLRWPAQGKVIASFGGRPDGTHNDGINLAVPLGTEVHAAESGVVVYAGSELKGYGNLVLLRHDNGWVTAYAHNDELTVKRGDKIQRGQVIAKAGKTGSVDQPQVHFELRQGSRPVDPLPYLERT